MTLRSRKLLIGCLVFAWAVQTLLVYVDHTADRLPPLSPLAMQGRQIWHDHNCQVCHQVHGFGGFLGPDLTNVAQRIGRDRLETLLTAGSMQMPAFHMDPPEIDAVEAYLAALDRTGIGQARAQRPLTQERIKETIEAAVREEHPMGDAAAAGWQHFSTGSCTACHVLFRTTFSGFAIPDLSSATTRLDDSMILKTLEHGRPERGMPPTGFDEQKRGEVLSFLHWLGEHRKHLVGEIGDDGGDAGIPWFEFK